MTAQTETAPQQTGAAPNPPVLPSTGIVKQVLSGDTVIVRGQPRGGPPPERTLSLAAINAARLGRRETAAGASETQDEPYAWEARELLRETCIGKAVRFVVEYKVPSGREFVRLYVPHPAGEPVPEGASQYGVNVAEELVAAGVVEVRNNDRGPSEYEQSLLAVQEKAKAAKKGKWNPDEKPSDHVRNVKWSHENPRALVDSYKQEPQKAIIEHVRDGSTVRALLLPNFDYVTVMMSGIRAPSVRASGDDAGKPEPFAEEAKFFTESHLLNKEVEIVLESVSNQNFLGTIKHPNGSIAALLLREGFAKCVDWSIGLASDGVEKLRSAEKAAKDKKLRLWRSYEPSAALPKDRKSFTATVTEIVMGDSMMIARDGTDTPVKISLSSVRAPRLQDIGGDNKENQESRPVGRDFRPLYDIPFMFEAREFLRKRLVGKKVQVTVDYVQPANVVGTQSYPERQCCTVVEGGVNVAEALVSKGLALVIRYREGDENRSAQYDDLMAAQAKAEKDNLKLHALRNNVLEKNATTRVQDLQGDAAKSKQFFPYLQRAGRCNAIVEFVSSGSRLRCFIPKETCLATILLAGINCPRGPRPTTDAKGTRMMPGEPYGEQAMAFTKSRCLQQEVQVEVESMDKAGNMIGWVFLNGKNMSEQLVREGLADVHFSAERSKYYTSLSNAVEQAKEAKKNMWANFVEETNVEDDLASAMSASAMNGAQQRKIDYKRIVLTGADVTPENRLRVAVQYADDGKRLETLMRDIDEHLRANPPLAGAHTPRRNEICLARFSVDNNWYRCKVESIRQGKADVFFIDYGNREAGVDVAKTTAALPEAFAKEAPGAREYLLALLTMPKDPDDVQNAINAMQNYCGDGELSVNIEYKQGGAENVTVVKNANKAGGSASKDEPDDVGRWLIESGLALADTKRIKQRLPDLCAKYDKAMMTAKSNRENLWRYGDPTEDEV